MERAKEIEREGQGGVSEKLFNFTQIASTRIHKNGRRRVNLCALLIPLPTADSRGVVQGEDSRFIKMLGLPGNADHLKCAN